MKRWWNSVVWKEAAPRAAADLAMAHLAAIVSLAMVMVVHPASGSSLQLAEVLENLKRYYLRSFVPLSVVFPVVFLMSGFYTRSRGYAARHKWMTLARGVTLASLTYVFLNFLVTRADSLPRSSTLLFVALANTMMIGSRVLKAWLVSPAKHSQSTFSVVSTWGERSTEPVLVIGGGGYIGSILCRKLLNEGRRVRLLDSFVYGTAAVRDLFGHPRFELVIGDCRNIQSVVAAMNGVKAVIHLAAIVGDPACEQDRDSALEINYAATRMILEVAKGYGVRRFVFASSCSVYGETEQIVDEMSEVGPISLYAQTKVDSETAVLAARGENFHPTILRLATVFGNSYRPRFDLVVNLLTAKALQEGLITVYNGEQWRPFIHVSDVAEGLIAVLNGPESIVSGEIYNLGDSRLNYTLTQVAGTIQRLVPGTRVEHVENPDRRNYRVSFDKVRDQLGFECRVDLEAGVSDLIEALRAGTIGDYTDSQYHNQRFLKAAGRLASKQEIDSQVMAAFAAAVENQSHGAGQLRTAGR
jgi:nucleoside-diphosphate-sugar epimerase